MASSVASASCGGRGSTKWTEARLRCLSFDFEVGSEEECGRAEVVEGVKPGETVVAVSGSFVRDGDKVVPVPAQLAASEP